MNSKSANPARKRTILEQGKLHHHYHKRKGSYTFIRQNFIKLGLTIVVLGLGLYLINTYVIDIDTIVSDYLAHLERVQVLSVFFASESFLGLLPPDLFIIWSKSHTQEWLTIGMLAALSYAGGHVSFQLGRWINHIPSFHKWLHRKYEGSIAQFQKFGALVIVLGALTPLPFSPISIISGSLEYSRRRYTFYALARFVRFFIYGSLLLRL